MQIDFRRNGTNLPPIKVGEQCFIKVKSYKLLDVWFDADLKWGTNTEFVIKKAVYPL